MQKLLDDPTYKPIIIDPTTYLERTTRTKIINAPLNEDTKKSVIPRKNPPSAQKMFDLPKIPKENVPLRPIVSSIELPNQKTSPYPIAGEPAKPIWGVDDVLI
ncbi:hypothetical protein Trydic_g22662 [Trypoxylus dichotomus]